MAAMTCRVCGRTALASNKETITDENGKAVEIRFTMTFPCGHVQDKHRTQKLVDGRRDTHRF